GRARARRPRAALGDVADARRRAADGAVRLEAADRRAARAARAVRSALIAGLLRLDDRVAADRQRRHRPAGGHAVVVEDLRVHADRIRGRARAARALEADRRGLAVGLALVGAVLHA